MAPEEPKQNHNAGTVYYSLCPGRGSLRHPPMPAYPGITGRHRPESAFSEYRAAGLQCRSTVSKTHRAH
jgi:hypothetical protein